LLVGLLQAFCVYFAPEFVPVAPYLLMGLVLLLRPHGLFGRAEVRRV
jgi:branched-chain amino acid transport system permease protein